MFRNQYDGDVTTFSPEGRLHQVEYAMEAVKQGSAAVGARSKTHCVVAALKRAPSKLSSYQRKIIEIDDNIGIVIAGLTADGRLLSRFMRNECLRNKFVYEGHTAVGRLVQAVADKSQRYTQIEVRRPYGVGLLVAGVDETGPHLFQTCPSGNYYEYHAMSIGARSQGARTYLEKNYASFEEASLEDLIGHALKALKETVPAGQGFNEKNVSLGIVGIDHPFKVLDGSDVEPYVRDLASEDAAADEMEVAA
mmetsp:Transcript_48673/g.126315  ORF Transcript_48673/g.126315 Transcript_48673/m.126315 type:complete len:251 (+) Transcript_48673:83-835(+)|eukprot:CAMPEP_0113881736 /NCGR_PEP_ID=MMETSP0780_2-20120614/8548_1 /TAXON_ID=652834 /ORGANISM="Palpitomonas bilix" /LENGTH=250 /DNA_ID=CAMNT_0000868639 /DNA_START=83 /DNA_END=835 /DNA_ORIENTATION=- /assembly_acc=CAM_ASM_000599